MTQTTRRAAIIGAAGAGLAVTLGACADDSTGGGAAPGGQTAGGDGEAAKAIAQTSEIPVGGGKIIEDQKIVITQPSAGNFKAFSAVCTHQGCLVGSVANGVIVCPCHQSMFDVTDGSVKGGPASAPLDEKKIAVSGTGISLA